MLKMNLFIFATLLCCAFLEFYIYMYIYLLLLLLLSLCIYLFIYFNLGLFSTCRHAIFVAHTEEGLAEEVNLRNNC